MSSPAFSLSSPFFSFSASSWRQPNNRGRGAIYNTCITILTLPLLKTEKDIHSHTHPGKSLTFLYICPFLSFRTLGTYLDQLASKNTPYWYHVSCVSTSGRPFCKLWHLVKTSEISNFSRFCVYFSAVTMVLVFFLF